MCGCLLPILRFLPSFGLNSDGNSIRLIKQGDPEDRRATKPVQSTHGVDVPNLHDSLQAEAAAREEVENYVGQRVALALNTFGNRDIIDRAQDGNDDELQEIVERKVDYGGGLVKRPTSLYDNLLLAACRLLLAACGLLIFQ